jgi:hypothetical protein
VKSILCVVWLAPSKFPRIVIHFKARVAPSVFSALGRYFKILGGGHRRMS